MAVVATDETDTINDDVTFSEIDAPEDDDRDDELYLVESSELKDSPADSADTDEYNEEGNIFALGTASLFSG